MIVPMKKYSFLVYHKEYLPFLEGIQELGVLHVIEKQTGEIEDEDIRLKYQQVHQLSDAIKFLVKREVEPVADSPKKDGLRILAELREMQKDQEEYLQRLAHLTKEKSLLQPWGDFSWETIENLKEAGYSTDFYICPSRNYDPEWENRYSISLIDDQGGMKYFVVIHAPEEKPEIEAENIILPKISLSKLEKSIQEIDAILGKTEDLYNKFAASYLPALQNAREKLMEELNFNKVVLSTQKEAEEKIMFLEGWVPREQEEVINDFLDKQGVFYEVESPQITDNVPIKLKNSRFSRLFEPVGELYTMPDYKELDLTPFFAPFFMMFFGFCLGDVGYGLIILLAALILRPRVNAQMKSILTLGAFLGGATIFMGLLGGTLFGINLIDSGYTITANTIAALKASGVPSDILDQLSALLNTHIDKQSTFLSQVKGAIGAEALSSYRFQILRFVESDFKVLNYIRFLMMNTDQLMMLSFAVGGVQTIFGMGIKAANRAKQFGFVHALSTIGWMIVIVGGATLFGLSKAEMISPSHVKLFGILVAAVGGIFIFFMNTPGKNIFLNFGLGIWDTYGMASGLLGDLLSYVRLFALGISSAVLGNVFNQLAFSLSPDIIVVKQLTIIAILAFGHGLNLFMSALGSFVHPLRLTFVEFYKNAGFSGGGKKYDPFRKALNIE